MSAQLFDVNVWVALAFHTHPAHESAKRASSPPAVKRPLFFVARRSSPFCDWSAYAKFDLPSPKRWMDAYLAAFARAYGIPLLTLDSDFLGFKNLDVQILFAE